jgi:hypothetical protein
MATRHAIWTLTFWVVWLIVVWWASHFVAARWPGMGDVLGVLGSLVLFLPTASLLVWDIMSRFGRRPVRAGDGPARTGEGYQPFSWMQLSVYALGITLVGIGFGVSFVASGS